MPLFTYECTSCGESAELLVANGAAVKCPECGSKKMEKALSHFAAVSGDGLGGDMPAPCDMGNMCCGGGCGVPMN